ncbi:hypothetical protein [Aestuariirhabdus sp. LZHN29]|uniref:hypothetical protein n=1 Tax=Aestuariirhabdus sp. LZHN29 TaxID=3417462 RepID=UPI003CF74166
MKYSYDEILSHVFTQGALKDYFIGQGKPTIKELTALLLLEKLTTLDVLLQQLQQEQQAVDLPELSNQLFTAAQDMASKFKRQKTVRPSSRKNRKNRTSPEIVSEIHLLRSKGFSIRGISSRLGIGRSTVSDYLQKAS